MAGGFDTSLDTLQAAGDDSGRAVCFLRGTLSCLGSSSEKHAGKTRRAGKEGSLPGKVSPVMRPYANIAGRAALADGSCHGIGGQGPQQKLVPGAVPVGQGAVCWPARTRCHRRRACARGRCAGPARWRPCGPVGCTGSCPGDIGGHHGEHGVAGGGRLRPARPGPGHGARACRRRSVPGQEAPLGVIDIAQRVEDHQAATRMPCRSRHRLPRPLLSERSSGSPAASRQRQNRRPQWPRRRPTAPSASGAAEAARAAA